MKVGAEALLHFNVFYEVEPNVETHEMAEIRLAHKDCLLVKYRSIFRAADTAPNDPSAGFDRDIVSLEPWGNYVCFRYKDYIVLVVHPTLPCACLRCH